MKNNLIYLPKVTISHKSMPNAHLQEVENWHSTIISNIIIIIIIVINIIFNLKIIIIFTTIIIIVIIITSISTINVIIITFLFCMQSTSNGSKR